MTQIRPGLLCMSSPTEVEVRGARSDFIKPMVAENQSFAVMLFVTSDGQKLPSCVIFMRAMFLNRCKRLSGIHAVIKEKGWMDKALMKYWDGN